METRGKGVSTTKFCKDGTPKHAGNFSPTTIHYQSLVSKDYPVKRMLLDDGTETLVIIGKTETRPLAEFMPQSVVDYVLSDPFFKSLSREGTIPVGKKQYECFKELRRLTYKYMDGREWTLRLGIYTDFEFNWNFPEL